MEHWWNTVVAGGPIHSDIGAPGRGVPPCLPYRTAACRRSRLRRASTAPSDAVAAVARPRVSEAFEEDMMGVDAAKPLRRRLNRGLAGEHRAPVSCSNENDRVFQTHSVDCDEEANLRPALANLQNICCSVTRGSIGPTMPRGHASAAIYLLACPL